MADLLSPFDVFGNAMLLLSTFSFVLFTLFAFTVWILTDLGFSRVFVVLFCLKMKCLFLLIWRIDLLSDSCISFLIWMVNRLDIVCADAYFLWICIRSSFILDNLSIELRSLSCLSLVISFLICSASCRNSFLISTGSNSMPDSWVLLSCKISTFSCHRVRSPPVILTIHLY